MRDAFDGPVDGERSGFAGGAAIEAGGSAWVLVDDAPLRAIGRALAWAHGREVDVLHVLVDDAAGVLARRATQFESPPVVWWVRGREVHPVEPEPMPTRAEPSAAAIALAPVIEAGGADVVVEHGVVRGEVLGLEIATVVVDDRGPRVEVGVGRHDREAFGIIHGDLPTEEAVAAVVREVRARRHPDAPDHPLKNLVPERWLREIVVAQPELVAAGALERIEGPVRRDSVKDVVPAFAANADVVVACSVGIDLDLVPTAADARLAHAPDAELVLVIPERDDHPVTRALAAALRHPAKIVTVPDDWRTIMAVASP